MGGESSESHWSHAPDSRAPLLRQPHTALVHAEVVRHLVPYCISQEFFQVRAVPGHAYVRALEDGDAVRHGESVADAPGGQGPALIQP